MCILPCAFCVLLLSGCAARRLTLPTDAGSPLADFAQIHAQVSATCAGIRTLTAELALSGDAHGQRLRGRVLAGFARPASMRLEGVAPFGPPAFILAAQNQMATLLLPRDDRVVKGAGAEEILEALTGIALAPADMQAVLTGCVLPMPQAAGGRLHANGWVSLDLGPATLYLVREGTMWQLRAARRGEWQIEYAGWQGGLPRDVRLRSMANNVDLRAGIGQLETNTDLDAAAFTVSVPAGAESISLDELRQAGPLRGK